MKTDAIRPFRRAPGRPLKPAGQSLAPASVAASKLSRWVSAAEHDFLVPNPRPDLTLDPQTLRMIEAG